MAIRQSSLRWSKSSEVERLASRLSDRLQQLAKEARGRPLYKPRGVRWVMALTIAVTFVVFFAILFVFLSFDDKPDSNFLSGIALAGVITTVATTAAWMVGKLIDSKSIGRVAAFSKLCESFPELKFLNYVEVEVAGTGGFPWIYHNSKDHKAPSRACLLGTYRDRRIAWIEFAQTLFAPTPTRRAADLILFLEPVANVPDLFIQPKVEATTDYLRADLIGTSTEFEADTRRAGGLTQPLGVLWGVASDPDFPTLFAGSKLQQLVNTNRSMFLQVVGGYCAIHGPVWLRNIPYGRPSTESKIRETLDFACAVHDAVRELGVRKQELAQ